MTLERVDAPIQAFTARRGEFYAEGVEQGDYRLRTDGAPRCAENIEVLGPAEPMTELGNVVWELMPRQPGGLWSLSLVLYPAQFAKQPRDQDPGWTSGSVAYDTTNSVRQNLQ